MPLIYQQYIWANDLRNNPARLYVFGDNLLRVGHGGQAREMRGAKNAVGLPTKRSPREFLQDSDLAEVQQATSKAITRLERQLFNGGTVVWPASGIGTGFAELASRAPTIRQWYDKLLLRLEDY